MPAMLRTLNCCVFVLYVCLSTSNAQIAPPLAATYSFLPNESFRLDKPKSLDELADKLVQYMSSHIDVSSNAADYLQTHPSEYAIWSPRWTYETFNDNSETPALAYTIFTKLLTQSRESKVDSNLHKSSILSMAVAVFELECHLHPAPGFKPVKSIDFNIDRDLILALCDVGIVPQLDEFAAEFPDLFSKQRILERLIQIYSQYSANPQLANAFDKLGQSAVSINTKDWANLKGSEVFSKIGDYTSAKKLLTRAHGNAFNKARQARIKKLSSLNP